LMETGTNEWFLGRTDLLPRNPAYPPTFALSAIAMSLLLVSSSSPSNNNSYNNRTVCRSSDSQTQEADEDETLSRVPRISRPNEFSPGFQAHESTDGCSTTGTGRKFRILERNFRLLEKELQSDHMFSMLAVSCLSFRKSLRKQVSNRGSNPASKTRSKSLQVRSTSPKAYLFFQRSQTGSQSSEQQANRDYIFAGVLWLRRACKKNAGNVVMFCLCGVRRGKVLLSVVRDSANISNTANFSRVMCILQAHAWARDHLPVVCLTLSLSLRVSLFSSAERSYQTGNNANTSPQLSHESLYEKQICEQ
jgi:hypothetical protein